MYVYVVSVAYFLLWLQPGRHIRIAVFFLFMLQRVLSEAGLHGCVSASGLAAPSIEVKSLSASLARALAPIRSQLVQGKG